MSTLTSAFRAGLVLFAASSCFAAPIKIGALLKDRSPGFWTFAEQGMVETGKKLGVELIVKAPPTVMDVGAQFRLLTALEQEKIDVLVIAPTNPDQFEAPVAALVAKGIKVVTVDTPLKPGLAQAFVGADQNAMADDAAKLFASLVGDHDEVAILRNNSLDRTVIEREKKFFEVMKATHANVVMHADFYASSEKDTEAAQAKLLLEKYPNTKAIFASATRGTLATVKAARDKDLVGKIKVVGFGTYLPPEAAKAIDEGLLWGWVAQQPKDAGVKAIEAAVALASGEKVPAVIRPNYKLVTRENFHDADVQALLTP